MQIEIIMHTQNNTVEVRVTSNQFYANAQLEYCPYRNKEDFRNSKLYENMVSQCKNAIDTRIRAKQMVK
ncbi:hypothetical protein LCGC14_1998940 [marine sediment metagenome]|uniref:Uncharacterized protein n=1 Tax=marine sediment metagenome TaxID=412755 RepID=A0A0F9F414_9ZZZZ